MLQTWVALPEADEEQAPTFRNYPPGELPIFTATGVWMRLIAGEAFGLKNGIATHSPLFYLHVVLQAGARFGLPLGYPEFVPLPNDRTRPAGSGSPPPQALS